MPFGRVPKRLVSNALRVARRNIKSSTQVRNLQSQVRVIRRDTKPEVKHIGFQLSPLVTTLQNAQGVNISTFELFPLLNQGVGVSQRSGDKIRAVKFMMKYSLHNIDIGNQTNINRVRLMIVIDKRTNQLPIVLSEVNDPDVTSGFNLEPSCIRNESYRSKFQIVYDRTHELGGAGSLVGSQKDKFQMATKTFSKKISRLMTYVRAGGANTDMVSGTWYLLVKNTGTNALGPSIDFHARLSFTDV